MKLNDELMQKYLNRELSSKDSAEVEQTLKQFPGEYKNYISLISVHNNLKKIREQELPSAFTSAVMNRIDSLRSKSAADRNFIFGISGIFIILCAAVAVLVGWQALSGSDITSTTWVYDSTADGVNFLLNILSNLKSSTGLTIIGSIFSLSILITAYFFFEHQKHPARVK
jgi:hypothetical protein